MNRRTRYRFFERRLPSTQQLGSHPQRCSCYGSEIALLEGTEVSFSALKTNLPDLEITEYYWEFGDGTKRKGAEVSHIFEGKGSYRIQLGVTGEPDSTGLIPKA